MKRMQLLALSLLLVCGSVLANSADKPARVISTMIKRVVIVEAVYPESRELKLLDSAGNRFRVVVDQRVPNFDSIKPRDRIIAEYVESVALVIAPQDSELPIGNASMVEVVPDAEDPTILGVETRVVVATIEAINLSDRIVSIKSAEGDVRNVKVHPDARLDLVEVGDQLRLRVTRAVAVSLQSPGD